MGIESFTLGPSSLYIFDEAGAFTSGVPVAECFGDIPFSTDAELKYNFEFETPLVQEFAGGGWSIDVGLLQTISGQSSKYSIEFYADVEVPARKHRKKRINKKWLKRYGYKTVRRKISLQCDQIAITPDEDGLGVGFDVEGAKYL